VDAVATDDVALETDEECAGVEVWGLPPDTTL
jgi:hypothetical protein